MSRFLRYLRDPYYWRRGVLRVFEWVTRRTHLETELDRLLADNWPLGEVPVPEAEPRPGSGLRLLYVAPKFDYGNPARGYSYEENQFLPAMAALGFDVVRLDSLTVIGRLGRRVASDLLVELAFRFRPHAAFFVLFKDDFDASAVGELARLGCVTLNWFTDDHWRLETFSSRWAPKFTWAITTDPQAVEQYRRRGITNVILSQWGVNHRLYRPLERPRRYGVTFIGQPHGDRRAVVRHLAALGIPVETWGYGWPRGKISTRQAVEIINESAVNLNLSNAVIPTYEQIKGRDFEVPACRGLLLTGRVGGLEQYYEPEKEVLAYDSFDDMARRIRWALEHPAEADRVREAGYSRVLGEHTYERRFAAIFRHASVFR